MQTPSSLLVCECVCVFYVSLFVYIFICNMFCPVYHLTPPPVSSAIQQWKFIFHFSGHSVRGLANWSSYPSENHPPSAPFTLHVPLFVPGHKQTKMNHSPPVPFSASSIQYTWNIKKSQTAINNTLLIDDFTQTKTYAKHCPNYDESGKVFATFYAAQPTAYLRYYLPRGLPPLSRVALYND